MDILSEVRNICAQPAFREDLVTVLCELCSVDTSPSADLARMRRNEERVFGIIRQALERLNINGARVAWKEISPAIQQHAAFSRPYYALESGRAGSVAEDAAEVYRGRGNLLFFIDRPPAAAGAGCAVNAHIDTVAPYYPPRRQGEVVTGRGTADDKGNVAVILGALHVLAELEHRAAVSLRHQITAMFVIDEETGGNGSLDLALDRGLKQRYDSLLVLECTAHRLHPANRGAVFVRSAAHLVGEWGEQATTPSLLEAFSFAVLELLDEGAAIRAESDHPLFPHRPVQTCTGILGPFGVHPTAICGEVVTELVWTEVPTETQLRGIVERGIALYVARFGDKTRVVDPATGGPRVARHYDLAWPDRRSCCLAIHGSTGHAGSLPDNDAAIAKWAYVVRELVAAKRAQVLSFTLAFPSDVPPAELVFEGSQGFLPTHSMEQVKARTRAAFLRGIEDYRTAGGWPAGCIRCEVTYDKLHNDAFAGDPHSESMRRAIRAAEELGMRQPGEAVRGWDVSCDARLFASEYPGMPVLTFGAGHLEHAHSDGERLHVGDLMQAVCFTALFLLRETGAIEPVADSG